MPSGGRSTAARPHRAGVDFGEEGERYYLVEAFVDAEPLDHVLRDGKPLRSLRRASTLRASSPTRSPTPTERRRRPRHPHIRDRALSPRGSHRVRCSRALRTAAAARVPYSAPERLAGTRDDPRSDVFALGLLLFEMLEGSASSRAATKRSGDPASTVMGRSCRSSPASRPRVSGLVGERSASRLPIGSRAWPRCGARSTMPAPPRGRNGQVKAPRVGDVPVRRHPVLCRRGRSSSRRGPGRAPAGRGPLETRPLGAGRRRVAVKVDRHRPAPAAPAGSSRERAGCGGVASRLSIAGVIVIAAVGVAASWPILRSITGCRGAGGRIGRCQRPVEQPGPATEPPPCPPGAGRTRCGRGGPGTARACRVLDRVAPAEEDQPAECPRGARRQPARSPSRCRTWRRHDRQATRRAGATRSASPRAPGSI